MKTQDRAAQLAARFDVTNVRNATVAARLRGHSSIGSIVVSGGKFKVINTTFVGRKTMVEYLGGPFTQSEAVAFLEAFNG